MIDQASALRTMVSRMAAPPLPVPLVVARPTNCRSFAVVSGKGGVGKTNVALTLAIMFAALKKKVILLDADLGLANVHIMLGMAAKYSLADVADGRCTLEQSLCTGPQGIHLIPGASGLESMANIDRMRLGLLQRQLQTLEQAYDILIVDTAAGIGSITTEFAAACDHALLVVTPEPTSLADAYATVKTLSRRGMAVPYVVVNQAQTDLEGRETFDKLNTLVVKFLQSSLELLAIVPFDRAVSRSVKKQQPLCCTQPDHPVAQRLYAAARRLAGLGASHKKEGFFTRFFGNKKI